MTNDTTHLDTFYAQGNDALSNMFELSFADYDEGIPDNLKYRVTNFSLADKIVNTYDKYYKGHKYSTPSGLDGDPKTNTFVFRLAKNMSFYMDLRAWADRCKNTPDIANALRATLVATPIDQAGEGTNEGWTHEGWYPTNVQGLTFDQNSGEPLTVQVTGSYMHLREPSAGSVVAEA